MLNKIFHSYSTGGLAEAFVTCSSNPGSYCTSVLGKEGLEYWGGGGGGGGGGARFRYRGGGAKGGRIPSRHMTS